MPKLVNTSLLNVHDVVLIGCIAVAAHIILLPAYRAIMGAGSN